MLAARYDGPGRLSLAELPEPEAGPGEVVVQVAACGICGSDLHAYRSSSFGLQPGQVMGHEFSGTVLQAPGVTGITVGDHVAVRPQQPCGACSSCLAGHVQLCERGLAGIIGYGPAGGFAERALIPNVVSDETVFVLPATIDDRAGALIEPLAVALRAVKQAGDVTGAVALVCGGGMIGLGVAQFLRLNGASTIIVADPSARRRDAALILGADVAVDPGERRIVDAVADVTGPGAGGAGARADVVVDCAGADDTLGEGIAAARPGATVVACAIYGKRVSLRPDWIVSKELVVRGSFAYNNEFREVIAALAAGHIDPALFISHEFPLERIEDAFQTQSDPHASLKVLVRPS